MKNTQERFCCYCGTSLGVPSTYDRSDTCGAPECDREARAMEQEAREERRELAERDDFDRY